MQSTLPTALYIPPCLIFAHPPQLWENNGPGSESISCLIIREVCVKGERVTSIFVHVRLVRGMSGRGKGAALCRRPGSEPDFPTWAWKRRRLVKGEQRTAVLMWQLFKGPKSACLWWAEAPWVPISVVSLWRWQLAVDHHPAPTDTHQGYGFESISLRGTFRWNVFFLSFFFSILLHIQFSYIVLKCHQSNMVPPLRIPLRTAVPPLLSCALALDSLSSPPFIRACCQSAGVCPCRW